MKKNEIYVAFLRGINVGGNNIIKMQSLKKCFEKIGFEKVKTYIASGNVIFMAPQKSKAMLIKSISETLLDQLGYSGRVILRTYKEMEETVKFFPKVFEKQDWKHNVIFLEDQFDQDRFIKEFELDQSIEKLKSIPGVFYWSAQLKTISRSKMIKLSAKLQYQQMTVRNLNTTQKVLEIMQEHKKDLR